MGREGADGREQSRPDPQTSIRLWGGPGGRGLG